MDGRAGRDYMPRIYWQVTAAVLAIGLEAPQVRACQCLRSEWHRTRQWRLPLAVIEDRNVNLRTMSRDFIVWRSPARDERGCTIVRTGGGAAVHR